MNKKPGLNKENKERQQRVKTPDINAQKRKPKIKKAMGGPSTTTNITHINPNIPKKPNIKQTANANPNAKVEPKKKIKFAENKDKKEEPKVDLVKEERSKSDKKKLPKNKVVKKEEKKEDKKEIKKNKEVMNKTGDNFYKPKIQPKKNNLNNNTNNNNTNNNNDKLRRKSVDIAKKNKKTEKNKYKNALKPDTAKTKQNLNKTPDNKKVKNRKKGDKKEKENDIKNIHTIPNDKSNNKKNEIKDKKSEEKKDNTERKKSEQIEDKKIKIQEIINDTKIIEEKKEDKKEIVKEEEKKPEIKIEEKKEEKKEEAKEEEKVEMKEEKIKEEEKTEENEEKIEDKNEEQIEEEKSQIIEEKKEEIKTEIKEEKTEGKNEPKKSIKYLFSRSPKFSCNYKECLYLGLNSGFFNPVQKLNIMLNSKEMYSALDKKKLISELIINYNKLSTKNIKQTNTSEYDIEKINSPFNPKERSINSLNFIDKEEENKLMNELQHPYITEYFKLILTLLNEKNDEDKNIFEFFFKDLLEKYKTNNIKNLLMKNFVNTEVIINDEQFNNIQKMIGIKPDLLSPATLLRYNRAVAYSAFFLKDLYSYLNLKTDDGKYYYYQLRTNLPKNEYQDKIDKLKLLL